MKRYINILIYQSIKPVFPISALLFIEIIRPWKRKVYFSIKFSFFLRQLFRQIFYILYTHTHTHIIHIYILFIHKILFRHILEIFRARNESCNDMFSPSGLNQGYSASMDFITGLAVFAAKVVVCIYMLLHVGWLLYRLNSVLDIHARSLKNVINEQLLV